MDHAAGIDRALEHAKRSRLIEMVHELENENDSLRALYELEKRDNASLRTELAEMRANEHEVLALADKYKALARSYRAHYAPYFHSSNS